MRKIISNSLTIIPNIDSSVDMLNEIFREFLRRFRKCLQHDARWLVSGGDVTPGSPPSLNISRCLRHMSGDLLSVKAVASHPSDHLSPIKDDPAQRKNLNSSNIQRCHGNRLGRKSQISPSRAVGPVMLIIWIMNAFPDWTLVVAPRWGAGGRGHGVMECFI